MMTAFLQAGEARRVLLNKRITIGWYQCRIRERVEPDFCQRCQHFGHDSRNCRVQTAVARRCLRCGSNKHLARDCEEKEEFCLSCNASGHRANSMKRPVYRELVEKKRLLYQNV